MMDEDPPELVEVSRQQDAGTVSGLEPQLEELNMSKVPLTIVTGSNPSNERRNLK